MKIKQIKWGDKSWFGGGERYFAQLPLGYHARLTKWDVSDSWYWKLGLRATVGETGKAPTLEEAKAECQKAWEGLLIEAMEGKE